MGVFLDQPFWLCGAYEKLQYCCLFKLKKHQVANEIMRKNKNKILGLTNKFNIFKNLPNKGHSSHESPVYVSRSHFSG